jgi:hypothetical protein
MRSNRRRMPLRAYARACEVHCDFSGSFKDVSQGTVGRIVDSRPWISKTR